jgi:hypothetical protein
MNKKIPIIAFISMILAVFSMLIPLSASAYPEEPKHNAWAVIIGVSEYKRLDDIEGSAESAQELFQLLGPIWGEEHIRILLDSEASKLNIEAAIDWLVSNADASDTVLFYFAGHSEERQPFIAPYDADYYQGLWIDWITQGTLSESLNRLESENVVVILDVCHAGRFETTLSGTGRVVLMSSQADEDSWNSQFDDKGWRGAFSYYLLEALTEFDDADSNRDYELSVEELFSYAEPKTISHTTALDTIQHPVMSDQHSGEITLLMKSIFSVEPELPPDYDILILDNEVYPSDPIELTSAPGSVHDINIPPLVDITTGTRYVFASWSDGDTSVSRTIPRGGVYTANYTIQHQLLIQSAHGEPEGDGWYEAGSNITISVIPSEGRIIRQVFTGWSGDFSGDKPTTELTMDSPKTITANWRTDYTHLYLLVVGGVVLIGGTAVGRRTLARKRRERTVAPAPEEGTTQAPSPVHCTDCGAEIEPGDAFCAKCGKAVQE